MKKNSHSNIKPIGSNKPKKGMIFSKESTQIPQHHPQIQPQQIVITINDKPKSANRRKSDTTPNQQSTNENNSTNNNHTPLTKQLNRTQRCLPKKAAIQKRNKQITDKELTDNIFQARNIDLYTKSEDTTTTYKPDYCYSNYTTDGYKKGNNNMLIRHQSEDYQDNNNINHNAAKEDDKPLLIRTINILQLYIKTIKEAFATRLCSIIKRKNEEIASLKNDKECLMKANNHLKNKIIEMVYLVKVNDFNEERRCIDANRNMHQILIENSYLRKVNVLYPLNNKGGGGGEKEMKIEDKGISDDKGVTENKKEEVKGKHKRQKTQFKFNNESNDANKSSLSKEEEGQLPQSYSSSSSSNDAFKDSIIEINKLSKTMKRNPMNSEDINNNNTNSNLTTKDIIPLASSSSSYTSLSFFNKKQPLCYITPTNKDKKLIEFTQ